MSQPHLNRSDNVQPDPPLLFIVDDEPMLLELASIILEPLGYHVRTFRDPEVALQAFASANPRPDLVITDFAMQPLNGLALMKAVRDLQPGQKVLMISGTVEEPLFQDPASNPDSFLAKPYQAKELLDAVKALVA